MLKISLNLLINERTRKMLQWNKEDSRAVTYIGHQIL